MNKISFTATSEGVCLFDEASGLYAAPCLLQAQAACIVTIDGTTPSTHNGLLLANGEDLTIPVAPSAIRAIGNSTSGSLYIVGAQRSAYTGPSLIVDDSMVDTTGRHTVTGAGIFVTSDGLYTKSSGTLTYTLDKSVFNNTIPPMGIAAEVSYSTSDSNTHTLYAIGDSATNYIALKFGNGVLTLTVCITSDIHTISAAYPFTSALDYGTHHLLECALYTDEATIALDGVFAEPTAVSGYPVFTSQQSEQTILTSDGIILHQLAVIQSDVWHADDYDLNSGIPSFPCSDNCGLGVRER